MLQMSEEDIKQETEEVQDDSVEVELDAVESSEESEQSGQKVEVQAQETDEPQEDEHAEYSKNVQKRIKKLTEKYRQEERDKEEATRLAQTLREENEKLKSQMQNSQQAHLTEYGTRLEHQLNLARQAYRDAHDRGDLDKQFEAQQLLNQISIEQERYRLAKQQQERLQVERAPEQQSSPVQQPVQQRQQESAPEPDPRAQEWASKNEWFGQDEVMTYAAFGIHRKLVEEEGFDPTSDEYYNEIDRQIRSEFPHKFAGQKNGRSGQVASADTSASRKPQSGRRKVKLSPSQVAIAKKLNVPLEEYAKYVKD
jgi:GH15 family glucan-1,4-alpha-glucosidase